MLGHARISRTFRLLVLPRGPVDLPPAICGAASKPRRRPRRRDRVMFIAVRPDLALAQPVGVRHS